MTAKKIPPTVSEYMASIGAKGGKNGKGKTKVRDSAHYRKLVAIRRKNRAARK